MQLLAVNYHYIRDVKPLQGIYPRTIGELEAQLDEIGLYYEFLSQGELLQIIRGKKYPKGNYCVITFDDNLKEQIAAYECLEKKNIPAIFFSTTLPYLKNEVHDVHKLHHIYSSYSDADIAGILEKLFDFYEFEYDTKVLDEEYRYDTELKKKIKFFINFVLSEQKRKLVVERLFLESIESKDKFIDQFYMERRELKHLANKGMLGTHTHSHQPLATLPKNSVKEEISMSTDYLSELTGKTISTISYPFGGPAAVNHMVKDVACALGLELGFTMNRGLNSDSSLNNPLLLKRVDTNDAPGGKLKSTEYSL